MTKEKIMANTSFQGPVRSKNNYKLYSVTTSTGVDSDRTQGFGIKDARRFYLEEILSIPKQNLPRQPELSKIFGIK